MLQTVSSFQIIEYDFVDVYVAENRTEQTPVHNTQRRATVAGFEIIEWICKKHPSD